MPTPQGMWRSHVAVSTLGAFCCKMQCFCIRLLIEEPLCCKMQCQLHKACEEVMWLFPHWVHSVAKCNASNAITNLAPYGGAPLCCQMQGHHQPHSLHDVVHLNGVGLQWRRETRGQGGNVWCWEPMFSWKVCFDLGLRLTSCACEYDKFFHFMRIYIHSWAWQGWSMGQFNDWPQPLSTPLRYVHDRTPSLHTMATSKSKQGHLQQEQWHVPMIFYTQLYLTTCF